MNSTRWILMLFLMAGPQATSEVAGLNASATEPVTKETPVLAPFDS